MKKGSVTTLILILILIIGLSLLAYPSLSDFWNKKVQTQAVVNYLKEVEKLDDDKYIEIKKSAKDYNERLRDSSTQYKLPEELSDRYPNELNIGSGGMMGYVEIPKIGVYLPIYHTTNENVLQVASGHIEWTSLPIGGASTHSVLSSHRGLPSAKLFTDLDKIKEGDIFMLYVLDEELTYEVDSILIVEPDDTETLTVSEGKDLCTLVTCTPYGINTHRLLVRGHRIDNLVEAETVRVVSDALVIEKLVVAPFVLMPILLCMFVALMISTRKNKKRRNIK